MIPSSQGAHQMEEILLQIVLYFDLVAYQLPHLHR